MALKKAKSTHKVTKGNATSSVLLATPWLDGCTVQKFAGCSVPPHLARKSLLDAQFMFGLLSLLACIGSITGAGIQFSLNDVAFVRIAAEVWEHTMSYTASDDSAYMLWASALFLHLIDFYSISSDLINSILIAYDQYLQEVGGDNELLIKATAYMATVKHGQRNQHA